MQTPAHLRNAVAAALAAAILGTFPVSSASQPAGHLKFPVHAYPPELAEALLKRKQAEAAAIGSMPVPAAFSLVSSNYLWPSGQKLIVAFYGGSYEVWSEIAAIANQWAKVANVTFDFGLDPKTRSARTWDPNDPASVAAHVKVRLDVDSPSVRYAAVGREAFLKEFASGTLVLGGVAIAYPLWSAEDRADILHEFGHVLGFLHEQQRPDCQNEFRLSPGPGGEPTIFQVYKTLYDWDEEKTKTNLQLDGSYNISASGEPDKRSIFLYPTDEHVLPATLHGTKGPCYIGRKNLVLSKGDVERARRDYPFHTDNGITQLAAANLETLKQIASDHPLAAAPLLQRLANIEKALRPLVYIQVPGEEQRPAADELRGELQGSGYIAPGVENVRGKAASPPKPEVRYFSAADERQAREVARIVADKLGGAAEVPTRFIARREERKLPIEVWLAK